MWTEYDIGIFYDYSGLKTNISDVLAGKTNLSHLFYTRVVTNQLRYGPLSKDFLPFPSPINMNTENTKEMYRIGINTLATDYISPEQIKNHIWTWNETLNVNQLAQTYSNYCILLQPNSTYWSIALCKKQYPVLCQHKVNRDNFIQGDWIANPHLYIDLKHNKSIYTINNTKVCPTAYVFAPPITSRQNDFAQHYVNSKNIPMWIGFRFEDYYFHFYVYFNKVKQD